MTNKELIEVLRKNIDYLNDQMIEKEIQLKKAYSEIERCKEETKRFEALVADQKKRIEQLRADNMPLQMQIASLSDDIRREKRITDAFAAVVQRLH